MSKTIDEVMDELQDGLDFSYIIAEMQGKPLTEKQHRTKERILMNLVISETPEHKARLREILECAND